MVEIFLNGNVSGNDEIPHNEEGVTEYQSAFSFIKKKMI